MTKLTAWCKFTFSGCYYCRRIAVRTNREYKDVFYALHINHTPLPGIDS